MQDEKSDLAADGLPSAVLAIQAELPTIARTSEGQVGNHKYLYAPLDAIWPKVLPLLQKYGLTWTCGPDVEGDRFGVRWQLFHVMSGTQLTGFYPVSEGRPQDVGSALTYARRYALCAVLGIIVAGDDDDGKAAESQTSAARPGPSPARRTPTDPDLSLHADALRKARTIPELQDAWEKVGKAGLGRNPDLVELKDRRKVELNGGIA